MDKDELRRLAEAATPGDRELYWDANSHLFSGRIVTRSPNTFHEILIAFSDDDDAKFIAAASPTTIISLLDEIAAKDAEIDRLEAGRKNLVAECEDYAAAASAAEVTVEALHAEVERQRAAHEDKISRMMEQVNGEKYYRKQAEAEVERLKPVVDAAVAWCQWYRAAAATLGGTLMKAVRAYEAKMKEVG